MRLSEGAGVLLAIVGSLAPTFACACGPTQSLCEALGTADAIFVADIEQTLEGYSPRYLVEKVYVGTLNSGTVLEPESLGATICGDDFAPGARGRYLVYGRKAGTTYRTGCGRTKRIEEADEDLIYLEQTLRSSPENLVTGAGLSQSDNAIRPVKHERVSAVNRSGPNFTAVSDDAGVFRFRNLPAGDYTFEAVGGHRGLIRTIERRVPPRGCVTVQLWAK